MMELWGVFIDISCMSKNEKESFEAFANGDKSNLLFDFENLHDAIKICEDLNTDHKRQIIQKLVSQCGYSVERAHECTKTLKLRYYVEQFYE